MSNKVIFIAIATLMALTGCSQNPKNTPDCDNDGKMEYTIDYTVSFDSDHDSTMQLTASSNRGTVKVDQVESENLIGEYGKPVKNTFIILEDSVPLGESITLYRGDLSYTVGKPEFIHNQVVGSDDLVELRILGTDTLTHSRPDAFSTILYSIRDNMFYDPYDAQSFTIPGGHRFSAILPIMTEEQYPKTSENHSIKIEFSIAANGAK